MARKHGKTGYAAVGTTEIGQRVSFDLEVTVQESESSTQGNDWTDTDAGMMSAKGSLEVFYDPADAGQDLMVVGETVALKLFLSGQAAASGNEKVEGNFLVTSVSVASASGDLIKRTYSVVNKGAVTTTAIA
jgi:hypothetical protein